jgi:hypothetical protein
MSLLKKIFALCLVPYAFWLVFAYDFHFIDWLNLFTHEGGHFLFTFFGEWLHFLGGTFAQLLVPLGIALYFLYRRQKYESAFCGFWFGESMMYMAGYMGDAQKQALPLLGNGIHDWNWMFSRMGVLEHCEGIATFFHVIASIIVLVSVAYMLYNAFRKKKPLVTSMTFLAPPIQRMKEAIESERADGETGKTNWSIWRQDDNGNIVLVRTGLTRTEAINLAAESNAQEHKQTFWAQETQ